MNAQFLSCWRFSILALSFDNRFYKRKKNDYVVAGEKVRQESE